MVRVTKNRFPILKYHNRKGHRDVSDYVYFQFYGTVKFYRARNYTINVKNIG